MDGNHRLYLHVLLPRPGALAILAVQKAPRSALVISGEHEARTRAGTGYGSVDCTVGGSHHRWISDNLSAWSLHLLHRFRREKHPPSEFN